MRHAWAGVAIVALTAVALLTPGASAHVAPDDNPRPTSATATWDASLPFYGVDGPLSPCDSSNHDICIESAWITSPEGERSPGRPFIDGGPDAGWLYQFDTDHGVETYWMAMMRTDLRTRSLVFLQLLSVKRGPYPSGSTCVALDPDFTQGWCVTEMRPDLRFGVTLRSSLVSSGWMDGRVNEPRVDVSGGMDGESSRVTIEGRAMRLPTLTATFDYDDPQQREEWSTLVEVSSRASGDDEGIVPKDWGQSEDGFYFAPFPERAPYEFNSLAKALPSVLRQATGWTTVWMVDSSFLAEGVKRTSKCDGAFNGLTTSNAMTYRRFAEWDPFTRELTFTMAGPHLDADGERLTGDFSMVLTEEAARCLWRTTDGIQDRVRVEITDADGKEVAATVSVTRKDGQIRLDARGFGFSLKQAQVTNIARGAPSAPQALRARVKGATLTVAWSSRPKVTYRMRVTTGDGNLRRVVRQFKTERPTAVVSGLASGEYRVEVVAVNKRGQSWPAVTTARIK